MDLLHIYHRSALKNFGRIIEVALNSQEDVKMVYANVAIDNTRRRRLNSRTPHRLISRHRAYRSARSQWDGQTTENYSQAINRLVSPLRVRQLPAKCV